MVRLILGLLVFAASDPPRPRTPVEELDSIRAAQTGASQQYGKGLNEAKTDEQRQKAVAAYLAEVVVNADRALDMARRHPGDPAAFDALVFVIRTARAGPSD